MVMKVRLVWKSMELRENCAERLAAIGQTIAALSHHIKNILQGVRGGSYLIDLGLKEQDETITRRRFSTFSA